MHRVPPGTIQQCSENEWVNTELFQEFMKHFVKHVVSTIQLL